MESTVIRMKTQLSNEQRGGLYETTKHLPASEDARSTSFALHCHHHLLNKNKEALSTKIY